MLESIKKNVEFGCEQSLVSSFSYKKQGSTSNYRNGSKPDIKIFPKLLDFSNSLSLISRTLYSIVCLFFLSSAS